MLRPCIPEPSGNFDRDEIVKEQIGNGYGQHYPQRNHDVVERNVQRAVVTVIQLEADHDLHGELHNGTREVPGLPPDVSRRRSETWNTMSRTEFQNYGPNWYARFAHLPPGPPGALQ